MKKYISILIFIFMIFSLIPNAYPQANTYTITASYPSPHGSYHTLRLYPQELQSGACFAGEFYVDETTGHMHYCYDEDGDGDGSWDENFYTSLWKYDSEEDGEPVYLSDPTWLVGIGTTVPSTSFRLTVSDGSETGPGGILSQGVYDGTDVPTMGPGSWFAWHPEKAAIRIGNVTADADPANPWTSFYIDAYSTVSGGKNNLADGIGSTISGGENNVTGGASNPTHITISGGIDNNASGNYAVVGGGSTNIANNHQATIAGGIDNAVYSPSGFIGGGEENISGDSTDQINVTHTTVGGGNKNYAIGVFSTIPGGQENIASASYSSVGGGYKVAATGDYSSIGGGSGDAGNYQQATGDYSTIAGGLLNVAEGDRSTVGGGENNQAKGAHSNIGGGKDNTIDAAGTFSTIAGGNTNTASKISAFIGGGDNQTASGEYSVVAGGSNNTASGNNSVVLGGSTNTATGLFSTVLGGQSNTVNGNYSVAMGNSITINSDAINSFAWCSGGCTIGQPNLFAIADARLVVGRQDTDDGYTFHVHNDSSTQAVISTDASVGSNQALLWFDSAGSTAAIGQSNNGGLSLTGTGTDMDMIIDDTGNVGIGNDGFEPQQKLDVDGSIRSKEIRLCNEDRSECGLLKVAYSEGAWYAVYAP